MKELKKFKYVLERMLINKNDFDARMKLNKVNGLLIRIYGQRKTNMEWLDIISGIVNKRDNKYDIGCFSGIKDNKRWYVYLLLREDVNFDDISKDEIDRIIMNKNYNKPEDSRFVFYGGFYGNNELYLDRKNNLLRFIHNYNLYGLTEEEYFELEEILFNNYMKESKKNERIRRF